MIFCSIHRSVSCPIVIRENSSAANGISGRDTQPRHYTESKLEVSYHKYENPADEKIKSEDMEDTRRTLSTGSTNQGSYVLTETEVAVTGPAWV